MSHPLIVVSLAIIAWCGMAPLSPVYAQTTDAPTGLLCNLLTEPETCVITESRPDFGWIVNSTLQGDRQTAYRILVASSVALLKTEKANMWDSGKVVSPESINVLYSGKPLLPVTSYWWAVRTWNKQDKASQFSAPQRFNTGQFNRTGKHWPGESRWVELVDEAGKKNWTFENRVPVNFHKSSPRRMVSNPDGSWFVDFGQAAFATFQVTIDWTPAEAGAIEHTIQVAVGEKNKGSTVHTQPGGGIIYKKMAMEIRPGKHTYTLNFPRFKAHYPHSQTMPKMMPEVIPFRYCELMPGREEIFPEDPGREFFSILSWKVLILPQQV